MLEPIILSLKIASIATIFSFLFGVSLAYLLNKKNIPGKNFWETLLTLPMILPPSVTAIFADFAGQIGDLSAVHCWNYLM